MKKAFSLVEMIVVVGIIGVLAGVLLGTFSGSTDSARASRCLSNMRTLAAACQGYAMAHGHFPVAGSVEKFRIDTKRTSRKMNVKEIYYELPGWVSWYSQNAYASGPTSSKASAGWISSAFSTDQDERHYCITNGALWKYVSGNHDVYRCPSHVIKNKKGNDPNWSYLMNGYFGWTARPGTQVFDWGYAGVWYNGFQRSDRYLLFAEMPFADFDEVGVESKEITSAGQQCDCVLQYKGLEGAATTETIGFNHKIGKNIFAHVVFADGHAEKLTYPRGRMSVSEQQELTRWLCKGIDVSFDGKKYDNLTPDN